MSSRGRPRNVECDVLINTILSFRDRIFINSGVVLKTNTVWDEISLHLDTKIKASSLYSIVTNNRYNILDKIKQNLSISADASDMFDKSGEGSDCQKSSVDSSSVYNSNAINFDILISKQKFHEITHTVEYMRSTREAKETKRKYLKFIPGVWQRYFNKQIWENTRMKCGWNYQSPFLSLDGTSGQFTGKN